MQIPSGEYANGGEPLALCSNESHKVMRQCIFGGRGEWGVWESPDQPVATDGTYPTGITVMLLE